MDKDDFEYVRRLLYEKSEMVLDADKDYLVETRLLPVMKAEGLATLHDLVSQLRGGSYGPLHRRVVEAMAIHETYFFRETQLYECLRMQVLPHLIKSPRQTQRRRQTQRLWQTLRRRLMLYRQRIQR